MALVFTFSLLSQSIPDKKQDKRLYWVSVAAMAAGAAADSATSWRQYELNPMLRGKDGRLGKKGVSIKAAIAGGTVVAQWLCGKRSRKLFTKVNFAIAGCSSGLALRTIYLKREYKWAKKNTSLLQSRSE